MNKFGFLLLALSITLTTTIALIDVSPAKANQYCQIAHEGHSKGFRKEKRAWRSAIRNWESNARKKFGFRYNKWQLAKNRTKSCKYSGREHFCTAKASACAKRPLGQRILRPEGTVNTTKTN